MDFALSEEQEELQGLARQILEGELGHDRLKEVEAGEENFDRELWAKLADAGLFELERFRRINDACQHGRVEQQRQRLSLLRAPANLRRGQRKFFLDANLLRNGFGQRL